MRHAICLGAQQECGLGRPAPLLRQPLSMCPSPPEPNTERDLQRTFQRSGGGWPEAANALQRGEVGHVRAELYLRPPHTWACEAAQVTWALQQLQLHQKTD